MAQDTNLEGARPSESNYPPPPWDLRGQLYGSIWPLPARRLHFPVPPEFKVVVNLGRVGVFAGFVDYQPGSTLTYHELIAGLVVQLKGRWRYYFTMTQMYVDSEPSLYGGREKWGVPKELADFEAEFSRDNRDFKGIARKDGRVLAEGEFQGRLALPSKVRLPVPFPDVQMLHDRPYLSSGTFWSRLELCKGGMTIPYGSPLAELGVVGVKPWISFGGLDFRMHLEAAKPVE